MAKRKSIEELKEMALDDQAAAIAAASGMTQPLTPQKDLHATIDEQVTERLMNYEFAKAAEQEAQKRDRSKLELRPTVTAATLGGAVTTIIVAALTHYNVEITAPLTGAIATLAAAAFGWSARS